MNKKDVAKAGLWVLDWGIAVSALFAGACIKARSEIKAWSR